MSAFRKIVLVTGFVVLFAIVVGCIKIAGAGIVAASPPHSALSVALPSADPEGTVGPATSTPTPTPTAETIDRPQTGQTGQTGQIYLPLIVQSGAVPMVAATPHPILVQQSPAPGEELAPDGAIVLTFDRAMDQAAVEAAFQLVPAGETGETGETGNTENDTLASTDPLAGTFSWEDDRTLRFLPVEPLQRGRNYEVVLGEGARSRDGMPLEDRYDFRFATRGYLAVSRVIPADGSTDVAIDAAITVIFNRPVVPLTMVEQQEQLPQPLTLEPAVAGTGEWLNTAIYVFSPDEPLAHNTTYTAVVDGALHDTVGAPMQGAYRWTFSTTIPPAVEVARTAPHPGATLIPIETSVVVRFDQPIVADSARQAFRLSNEQGSEVGGEIGIGQRTLIFTPSQYLAFGTTYHIGIAAGVESSEGNRPLQAPYRATFTTVPLPRIVETYPADGDNEASPYTGFTINFNTIIDPDTVMPHLQMTPPLSPTQVYTASWGTSFYLRFGARPSTNYTVHISPGIADRYGNTIDESLDVRFRTAPLRPSLSLATPNYINTYSAHHPTRVRLRSVNASQATLSLYRLETQSLIHESFFSGRGNPPDGAVLERTWTVDIAASPDEVAFTRIRLAEDGNALAPGAYLLLLDTFSAYPDSHVLVVSDLNLTLKASERDTLAWATDLQSGEPVSNLAVTFYDTQGQQLGEATTDSEGIARLDPIERVRNRGVVAIAEQPFAAAHVNWSNGVGPWSFGLPEIDNLPEMTAHIYTDRPIYRPGQTVSFKGVLRAEDDVRFSLPADLAAVEVTISDNTYEERFHETLPLDDEYATFNGQVALPEGARPGTYTIRVAAGNETFQTSFTVATYRAPEFAVAVETPAENIVRGTPVRATIAVSYFFGMPVAHAPVEWSVKALPYNIAPEWAARYTFSDSDDPWYRPMCWDCWWVEGPKAEPLLGGSGTTDEQGNLFIDLPAQLVDSEGVPITDSVRLMIEATVTGRDNQVVSSQGSMVVHGSEQYVGLARRGSFGRAGEPQTVDIVTVDMAGQPAPEQQVEVDVFSYTWENRFIEEERRWEWDEQRTLVYSQTVTTGSHAQAEIAFTPPAGGSYRVVAREVGGAQSSLFLWVAGDGYLSWRRTNHDRITLLADQTSGRVGETVNILIPSPFSQPHYALITVERGGVLSHEVRRLEGNSHVYELVLTEEHIPNVFVSVVLFRPFTTLEGVRLPADYKVGILPVTVAPDPQTLHITLEPEGDGAQPGDTVRYNLRVTDDAGEPVVAELSLDLVDKAVLSLMPRTPDEILSVFYGKRALGVVTASGLAISADRALWDEQEQDDEWDDREKGGGLSPTATPAPAPSPTASPQPPGAPKPIDTLGEGEDPSATVRENFADTAYWNGSIETDADGRASVELTLPDNLTTWVMRGVGLTSDTRVGEGHVELVATKPLLIRPVVPRFFVVGDRVELAANVSNRTDAPLETNVGLTSRGLTVTTSLTQTVQIAARSEQRVTWPVVVQDVEMTDLIFSAVSGPYHDASKPQLATGPEGTVPVYRYSAPETVGTGGALSGYGTRTEVIALPPGLDDRRGTMTLRLAPSLAASLRDSLGYLEHFPYECTEQTVSRFLPNILTLEALKRLGVDAPELEARLPVLVEEGVDRLRQGQNLDGGWGWWQRGESNPFVSAYVVLGLLHAREAGFVVDDTMFNYGVRYLEATLEEGKANPDNPARLSDLRYANQQAWLVFVLAEVQASGLSLYGDIPAVLDDLYEHRDDLSIAGRALLAMAMRRMSEDDGRIETLLSDLNTAAIMRATGVHWEEGRGGRWSMSTDTRSTAIVLLAFVRLDPDNQLLPGVVRWLMVARQGDRWHTTQETAWALMSLTAWMEHTGELAPDYDYAAWLSWPDTGSEYRREMLVRDHMGPDNVSDVVVRRVAVADLLQSTQTWLTIGRSRGSGNLYYTTHLRAFLPVEEIEPLSRGIMVRRRYTLASCTEGPACPEIAEARTGDVIRVEVSVVAPNNLFYVVVEDPLPAGAEIIDETLETTESSNMDSEPSHLRQRWWWWWRWYDRSEFYDHRAMLFADYLPRGAYVYQYEIRATQPGEFRVIPPTANEIYFPETYGRGAGQLFTITP